MPGRDFEVVGRSLVFPRPLAQEGRLGFWRWASMWLGIAGTYRKHETVDVVYESDGTARGRDRPRAAAVRRTGQADAAASSRWDTRVAEQRGNGLREHVAPRAVQRAEVDRAVQLERRRSRVPGRQQVDADEVARAPPAAAASASARAIGGGSAGTTSAPRAALVRHSPRWRDAACGPDDLPAGDDESQVPARRLDELLRERAVLAEPALPLQPDERRVELLGSRAELDVASPAAEPRLQHERQLGDGGRKRRADVRRVRVRQAGEPERACGQQLVVRDDEGAGRVAYVHAACREPLELAGAALDAVEPLAHVEPGERNVSRLEERSARRGSTSSASRPQARAAATSASFVALRRWATTANFMPKSCGRAPLRWARSGDAVVSDSLPGSSGAVRAAAFGTGSSR